MRLVGEGGGDAAGETAAAEGDERDLGDAAERGDDLEAEARAVPRHDVDVVVRRDEVAARRLRLGERLGQLLGVVVVRGGSDHQLRSVAGDLLALDCGSGIGDHDTRMAAEHTRRVGDAGAVVAGAGRDGGDALAERRQRHESAAYLEATGHLERLDRQPHARRPGGVSPSIELGRPHHRRLAQTRLGEACREITHRFQQIRGGKEVIRRPLQRGDDETHVQGQTCVSPNGYSSPKHEFIESFTSSRAFRSTVFLSGSREPQQRATVGAHHALAWDFVSHALGDT